MKEKVAELKGQGISVCLAVIQVGDNPASTVYVGNKKKACAYVGIESLAYELPEEIPKSKMAFSLAVFLGWICMYAIPIVKSGGLFWYS